MPLLDLYITHYKEPWEVGDPGIRMLSLQRLVNWDDIRITMVHDGTEPFPEENFYGLKVRQVSIPHGGIAKTRNWCIDDSEAKWIKWCDFDDSFSYAYSLWDIMNVLGDDRNQLLWFDMWYQDFVYLNKLFIRNERDVVFVHNKIFNRRFLVSKNIRFQEDLTWCEDSAFMALVEMEVDRLRIGKIKTITPIYIYNVRDGSLCNRPEIKFENRKSFFKRHCYVAEEFLKRGHVDAFNTMLVRIMGDSFYTIVLHPKMDEYDMSEHEKEVWAYFDAHRDSFHACKPQNFDLALAAVNRENFDGGEITKEALMRWITDHEGGDS